MNKENQEEIKDEEKPKKLKPIVFMSGDQIPKFRNNVFQQNLLLKAMQVTTDPKKLKQMVGLKSVAEVYRTLDKLAIRKEFHEALARNGISLDYITSGIKSVADNASKESDKLNAYKTLLKALGLDQYDDSEGGSKSWEDILVTIAEEEEKSSLISGETTKNQSMEVYEVDEPPVPESVKKMRANEKEIGQSIYE